MSTFEFEMGSTLEIQLGYDMELSQQNNQVYFKEEATAVIHYESAKHFQNIIKDDIYALQSLLSISVHEISYITTLTFVRDGKPHKCLFTSPLYDDKYEYKHPAMNPLKYERIKENLPSIVIRWFGFMKENKNIVHLLVHSLKTKKQISEDKFMDLCRALELFHRSIVKTTPRSEEEYQNYVNEILSQLKGAIRKWCKGHLMRNSHSLETRRIELCSLYGIRYLEERLPAVLSPAKQLTEENLKEDRDKNKKAFFRKIANTKN